MLPIVRTTLGVTLSLLFVLPLTSTAAWSVGPANQGPGDKGPGDKGPDTEGDNSRSEDKPPKKSTVKKTTVIFKGSKPDLNIYPVHTKSNYCPAGLQPVTISGSISCGIPNTSVTYRHMMTHPQVVDVQKKGQLITLPQSATVRLA